MKITFKFFTEVLFLSIILCLANTGIVNVLVSTLYSKPDEVTGYECGLYSTKGGRLKDRISFYTVGLTMMIFDVEVVLTFAFLLISFLTFNTVHLRYPAVAVGLLRRKPYFIFLYSLLILS